MSDSDRIGPYQVLNVIGRGAMGTVYSARHIEDGSEVALKTLEFDNLDESIEQAAERFEREVMATSKLHHPGIIRVYESGQSRRGKGGLLYFAMELIEGETLHTALKRGPFVAGEAAAVVAKLADALNFAHGIGIIHRDIKPGNVFLASEQRVVVVDFGICKFLGAQVMTHGGVMGTLPFMAPEQILEDREIDHRVDVFAMGSLLYTLLTRRYLRPPTSLKSVLKAVNNDLDVAKVRGTTGLDPRLVEIMIRALSKDIDARYQRARDLMNDLWDLATEVPPFGEARSIPVDFTGQRFDVDNNTVPDSRAQADDPIADDTLTDVEPASPITGRKRSKSSSRWYSKKRSGTLSELSQRQLQQHIVQQSPQPVPLPAADDPMDQVDANIYRDIRPESTGVQRTLDRRRTRITVAVVVVGIALCAGSLLAWLRARPLRVHVDSRPPGAQVIIAGEIRGQTPLELSLDRRGADVKLVLQTRNRQTRRQVVPVSLLADAVRIDLELPFKPGRLDLISWPQGATAALDGRALCRTPCRQAKVQPGRPQVLTVNHRGCVPDLSLIELEADESSRREVHLRPASMSDLALLRLLPSLQSRRLDLNPIAGDDDEHLLVVFAGSHVLDLGATQSPRYQQLTISGSGRVHTHGREARSSKLKLPSLPGIPDTQNERARIQPPDIIAVQTRGWLLQRLQAPGNLAAQTRDLLKKALHWWPENADLHRIAALVAARRKIRSQIIQELRLVLKLDRDAADLESINLALADADEKAHCRSQ